MNRAAIAIGYPQALPCLSTCKKCDMLTIYLLTWVRTCRRFFCQFLHWHSILTNLISKAYAFPGSDSGSPSPCLATPRRYLSSHPLPRPSRVQKTFSPCTSHLSAVYPSAKPLVSCCPTPPLRIGPVADHIFDHQPQLATSLSSLRLVSTGSPIDTQKRFLPKPFLRPSMSGTTYTASCLSTVAS